MQDLEEEIELESDYFETFSAEKIEELGLRDIDRAIGEYVLVLYDGNPYSGVTTEIESEIIKINAMVSHWNLGNGPKRPIQFGIAVTKYLVR